MKRLINNTIEEFLNNKKEFVSQFFKFGIVGVSGIFVNIAILFVFTEYFKVYYIISALISFVVAGISNFLLNKIWTFGEDLHHLILKKYIIFFVVSVAALFVNIFFLYIFTEFFGIYYIVSQVLAIGIAFMINFIGNKVWTFAKPRD